jgi:hypothetical protein
MIRSAQTLWSTVALSMVVCCSTGSAQQQGQPKPIKVVLTVEAQGPEGLWIQAGKDLSPAELKELRSLITARLRKMSNHQLVSSDEKDNVIGLVVVAEKLQCGRETYILLSSALTIGKADGTDLFLTHDVFAQPSLTLAANAAVGQLATIELRGMLGLR